MQPNELTAVLKKTSEVAVYPAHIESYLPSEIQSPSRNRFRQVYCPTGLIRGVVIENGYKWIEKRQVSACGTQDYEIQRKNGVLVEFDAADVTARGAKIIGDKVFSSDQAKLSAKVRKHFAHTTVTRTHDGKQVVHMIVSRKAIFSDWTSYELEMARRQKQTEEYEALERALREPQAEIMGLPYDEFKKLHIIKTKSRKMYLGASFIKEYKYTKDGEYAYKNGKRVKLGEWAKLEIPLERVNQILHALKEIGDLASVRDEPGSPTEQIRQVLSDLMPESK